MSKHLKALIEKRNNLVQEMTEIVDVVETETRSLNEGEISRIDEIKLEIGSLDNTIKTTKEIRSMTSEVIKTTKEIHSMTSEVIETGEENNVDKDMKDLEVRGYEHFLRGRNTEEKRALDAATASTLGNDAEGVAGNGGVTVPTAVYNEIIEKLTETSPVFQAVRKFPSVTGNLKIAREDVIHDEGFIGETLDATKIQPTLKTVTLNQKRVGAATQLTNQLINDSGVDIVGYSNGLLTRSVMRAIERGILVGPKDPETADQSFRPIVGDADVRNVELAGKAPTVEELLDIYGSLNPAYLDDSMWIVSRKVFNAMLKYKDGDGTYLVFRDIVKGKPGYTLFGVPVYVTSVLTDQPDGKEIIFGNLSQAYGMLIKKNMNMIVVTADTTQALAGGRLAVLDAYMDGAVFNPDAVITAALTKAP